MGKKSRKNTTATKGHHHGKNKKAKQPTTKKAVTKPNEQAAKQPAAAAATKNDVSPLTTPPVVEQKINVPDSNDLTESPDPEGDANGNATGDENGVTAVEENGGIAVEENGGTEVEEKEATDEPPMELASSLHLMTDYQKNLAITLCSPPSNQSHIFKEWPESVDDNEADAKKKMLMEQFERMDKSYPNGGLAAYIQNAKVLLEQSRKGVNPLEGWKPSIPDGETFELGTEEYRKFEEKGMSEMGKCAFVLVAGGLGERLGYNGVKLALPTELATETIYLQLYIETIIAIQSKYAAPGVNLSLCIMVSNDTNAKTLGLLKDNDNFGLADEQITIVEQGEGVPAVIDNNATIAMDTSDKYKIQAKPHGHGDIHTLLHSNGVVKKWCAAGLEYVIFCQDTNGLAFHTLPLALGVSKDLDLIMNSIAVPRKAKQAIGGIAKLKKTTGEERTINVEYNQLDPLLRASGFPDGDVNDANGFSPFPGNINQLLFKLKPYSEALNRTQGAMPEFVNPKYADAEKTVFKKPTRLECMMQEFPATLDGDVVKQIGFTSIASDMCFSPVKNTIADGVVLQQKGTHPGVAASGEADQYAAFRKILSSVGCQVEEAAEVTFSGIKFIPGPEIVLKPNFVLCPGEYKTKFPQPASVKISSRSSLVVNGSGIVIESLDLDGALVIECEDGASGVVRDLVVKNKGWEKVADESSTSEEFIRMRGYHMNKIETQKIIFRKDGTVEGLPPPDKVEENIIEHADPFVKKTTPSSKVKDRSVELEVKVISKAESKAMLEKFDVTSPSNTTDAELDTKVQKDSGCCICQ